MLSEQEIGVATSLGEVSRNTLLEFLCYLSLASEGCSGMMILFFLYEHILKMR